MWKKKLPIGRQIQSKPTYRLVTFKDQAVDKSQVGIAVLIEFALSKWHKVFKIKRQTFAVSNFVIAEEIATVQPAQI